MACVIFLFSDAWQPFAILVFIVYLIQFLRIRGLGVRRKLAWDQVEKELAELAHWRVEQDAAEERACRQEAIA